MSGVVVQGERGRRGIAYGASIALLVALSSCAGEGPAPAVRRIEIRSFAFDPAAVDAGTGDTLVWTNRDFVPHTVTASDSAWDSGSLDPGGEWRRIVTEADGRPYACRFHPTMKGTIRVLPR